MYVSTLEPLNRPHLRCRGDPKSSGSVLVKANLAPPLLDCLGVPNHWQIHKYRVKFTMVDAVAGFWTVYGGMIVHHLVQK